MEMQRIISSLLGRNLLISVHYYLILEHSLDSIDKEEIDQISQGKFQTAPSDLITSLMTKYRVTIFHYF